MVKGRGPDSPLPQFKLGYVNLPVSAAEKELTVTLTSDKARYSPGETAAFAVRATDVSGRPVRAEFSLALVDKAVQSLVEDRSVAPVRAFWGQRGLAVITAASLIRGMERANQAARDEGGKGGGGGLLEKPVRQDFRDTAFWNAHVVTDPDGRATVTATLPDNLTTWNMTAKGVTASTQVGEARADILSTKDLLIRPGYAAVLRQRRPRQPGGRGQQQHAAADQAWTCAWRPEGSRSVAARSRRSPSRRTGQVKVTWEVTVGQVEEVTLTFSANGGALRDAVRADPARSPADGQETVATAGQVVTRIAESIQVPASADRTAGSSACRLSPSLAAASRESLRYLESFDYASSEQTVSRFLPNAAHLPGLKRLGIDRDGAEETARGQRQQGRAKAVRAFRIATAAGAGGLASPAGRSSAPMRCWPCSPPARPASPSTADRRSAPSSTWPRP